MVWGRPFLCQVLIMTRLGVLDKQSLGVPAGPFMHSRSWTCCCLGLDHFRGTCKFRLACQSVQAMSKCFFPLKTGVLEDGVLLASPSTPTKKGSTILRNILMGVEIGGSFWRPFKAIQRVDTLPNGFVVLCGRSLSWLVLEGNPIRTHRDTAMFVSMFRPSSSRAPRVCR